MLHREPMSSSSTSCCVICRPDELVGAECAIQWLVPAFKTASDTHIHDTSESHTARNALLTRLISVTNVLGVVVAYQGPKTQTSTPLLLSLAYLEFDLGRYRTYSWACRRRSPAPIALRRSLSTCSWILIRPLITFYQECLPILRVLSPYNKSTAPSSVGDQSAAFERERQPLNGQYHETS